VLARLARRHWVSESVLPMQLRSRRPWLRAPPANPAAGPRVGLAHTVRADRADPAHRAPADQADPAHRAPVDRADRLGPAHTAPADQVNSVDRADRVGQADQAHAAPVGPDNSADQADQADRAATARGMETRNMATSREPPGGTGKGPGARVSHQGRPTTDPFRRPAGDGTMVRSTTSVTNKHRGGIPDSTNGASTSSAFGSRCKDQLARCLLDQSAERAPRLPDCTHSP
ncbi:hypothetical protein MNAB215_4176, partial [Mycobacterium numidiamassiliense]